MTLPIAEVVDGGEGMVDSCAARLDLKMSDSNGTGKHLFVLYHS